jgi:hypothetical protein
MRPSIVWLLLLAACGGAPFSAPGDAGDAQALEAQDPPDVAAEAGTSEAGEAAETGLPEATALPEAAALPEASAEREASLEASVPEASPPEACALVAHSAGVAACLAATFSDCLSGYSAALAQAACEACSATPCGQPLSCDVFDDTLCASLSNGQVACWSYAGPLQGHLSVSNNGAVCPAPDNPFWG